MKSPLNRHAILKNLALFLFMGTLSATAHSLEGNSGTGKSLLQLMQEKQEAEQKAQKDAAQEARDEELKALPRDIEGLVEQSYQTYVESAKSIGCSNSSKITNKQYSEFLTRINKIKDGYVHNACSVKSSSDFPITHPLRTMNFERYMRPMIQGNSDRVLNRRKSMLGTSSERVVICDGMNSVEWYDKLYEAVESYKSSNPDAHKMALCGANAGF